MSTAFLSVNFTFLNSNLSVRTRYFRMYELPFEMVNKYRADLEHLNSHSVIVSDKEPSSKTLYNALMHGELKSRVIPFLNNNGSFGENKSVCGFYNFELKSIAHDHTDASDDEDDTSSNSDDSSDSNENNSEDYSDSSSENNLGFTLE